MNIFSKNILVVWGIITRLYMSVKTTTKVCSICIIYVHRALCATIQPINLARGKGWILVWLSTR